MNSFWDESNDVFTNSKPVTQSMVQQTEELLGYKLPSAYIELIKTRNGGIPVNTCFPTSSATSWAKDHIGISAIQGIGGLWGIDSDELGSEVMISEWGYPAIGIVICTCPSAGHDAVMLDYSQCGTKGEPTVIHVNVDDVDSPKITFLANHFQLFIDGLVNEKVFNKENDEA